MSLSKLNTKSIEDTICQIKELYEIGNYSGVFKKLSLSLKDIYEIGDLFIYRAMSYEKLGNLSEALKNYKVASHIQYGNYCLSNYLGELLYKIGKFKESAEFQVKSLKYNEKNIYAWVGLGYAEMGMCEYSNALKAFEQAILIDSNCVNALIGNAQILIKFSKPKEAVEYLRKSLNIEPNREDVISLLNSIDYDIKAEKQPLSASKFPFIKFENRPTHHDIKIQYKPNQNKFPDFL